MDQKHRTIVERLRREKQKALRSAPGASQSVEYRRLQNRINYYQNIETRRAYIKKKSDEINAAKRARYAVDPDYRAVRYAAQKKYRKENRGKARAACRAYRAKNPQAAQADKLRSYVRYALRSMKRDTPRSLRLFGATLAELRKHVEAQFEGGWSWANMGSAWEIDHIRPLVSFDFDFEGADALACHWKNLRPVTRSANLAKGHYR